LARNILKETGYKSVKSYFGLPKPVILVIRFGVTNQQMRHLEMIPPQKDVVDFSGVTVAGHRPCFGA
jgi:hypothetical protein